ncbi:MAG: hypothetical protein WED05_01480 [Candidatus Atabeyarchaeum deiterrae]
MKFSIVCPIKDEVDLALITLPSYYSIHPDEVILCLDKPAPRDVVTTIHRVAVGLGKENITRILEVERNPDYRFHQAWVRRIGFRAARNDVILTGDIDTMIDPKLREHFHLLEGNVKIVSFAKFSLTWHGAIAYLIQRLYPHKSFTGLYLFSRSAWLETEDEESLKKIPTWEDTHLHAALTEKYNDIFVPNVKNVVLRPKENKKYQFLMGWLISWKTRRIPVWRAIISSFLYYRPYVLVGYLEARCRGVKTI